jgi:photosystem II stability/assembly factor-like uncharacterized protein
MRKWLLAALLCPAVGGQLKPAQAKWTLQYFYDQFGKELRITDLAFPSATRGIAVGEIADRKGGRPQFTAVVTSDAGAHWSLVPLKEFPRSIFFLNETAGWLVTDEALWFTDEAGRGWKRLSGQIRPNRRLDRAPDAGLLLRVWFLDAQHGYGVGLQKSVYETRDGGRTWKPVEDAAKPVTGAAYSVYSQIAFADERRGIIAGGYMPPRASYMTDWLFPERELDRLQQPLMSIELETQDGGVRWSSGSAPVFGSLQRLRVAGRMGLAVFTYADSFEWPSEVYRLDLTTGKSVSVFKRKDRRVTDIAILEGGRTILAALEPPGRLRSTPIPGKVKMLVSSDLATWTEMAVDYRAVARSLVLAAPDPEHMWAATDTGMILRWTPPAGAK